MSILLDQMIEYANRRKIDKDITLKKSIERFELPQIGVGESYELIKPPIGNGNYMVEFYQRLFEAGGSVITLDFEGKQGCGRMMQFTEVIDRLKEKMERGDEIEFIVIDSLPNLSMERKNHELTTNAKTNSKRD